MSSYKVPTRVLSQIAPRDIFCGTPVPLGATLSSQALCSCLTSSTAPGTALPTPIPSPMHSKISLHLITKAFNWVKIIFCFCLFAFPLGACQL